MIEGPLSGIVVIDMTRVLAGPYAALLLAEMGARVIKVEPSRHGDDSRAIGPFFKTPSGTTPTPVVVIKSPSPLPCSTTLVSPVTIGTSASFAACAIESTMRLRSASGNPSSMMNPAAR